MDTTTQTAGLDKVVERALSSLCRHGTMDDMAEAVEVEITEGWLELDPGREELIASLQRLAAAGHERAAALLEAEQGSVAS